MRCASIRLSTRYPHGTAAFACMRTSAASVDHWNVREIERIEQTANRASVENSPKLGNADPGRSFEPPAGVL
jgi:hypothetical protein